jgi:hypothetical protein
MNFDGDFDEPVHNNNYDEIEVENVGSNARNNNQGYDDFFGHSNNEAQFVAGDWNVPASNIESNTFVEYVVNK